MTNSSKRKLIADNPKQLIQQVRQSLNDKGLDKDWGNFSGLGNVKGSAVLLLLTMYQSHPDIPAEPCLLLNKRSDKVLQPGDLCCPGGGVERLDKWLAPAMQCPLSPLRRWPSWSGWRAGHPGKAKGLALLLTTALREAFEEMRLNPLKVHFLGPLPVQQLIMFERLIYPLAAWVPSRQRLKPNWEVARIVRIPLKRLLDPGNYGRYRISYMANQKRLQRQDDFPCFIHQRRNGQEVLWGATFRIAMDFLEQVFGFELPDLSNAPVREKYLGSGYLNGSLMTQNNPDLPESLEDY